MQKLRSIILLSGGLDSAANLAYAIETTDVHCALTFDYGQKAAKREVEAAQRFCDSYGVNHNVIELPWLGQLGGNALTENGVLPEVKPGDLDDLRHTEKSAKAVWVPNRNGLFVEIAAAFADRFEVPQIFVGFNAEEANTFPDNSNSYRERINEALKYSCRNQVELVSITQNLNKDEIVAALKAKNVLGVELSRDFPFDFVWSCYEGGAQRCGKCESCRRLERAIGKNL